jgi:hypothetical protein
VYEARLNSQLGIPMDFDSLNTSMVYAPGDVADRCGLQLLAFLNNCSAERFWHTLCVTQYMSV